MIRVFLHLIALSPYCFLVFAALLQKLGADPQEVLLHEMGLWALHWLLVTLAVTPARHVFHVTWLVKYRRLFGLYFFFYVSNHLLVYCWFFIDWDFELLVEDIVERPYITVGMLAFLLSIPLALTSNKWSMKALKKRWKQLHKLVFLIAILGSVHFIWQTKSDLNRPLIYLLILIVLLLVRIWVFFERKRPVSIEN